MKTIIEPFRIKSVEPIAALRHFIAVFEPAVLCPPLSLHDAGAS